MFWLPYRILNLEFARSSGVFPLKSEALTSLPACSRRVTILTWFVQAARWRGVFPLRSFAFGLAPFSSRTFRVWAFPCAAAKWRAVLCFESAPDTFTPLLISSNNVLVSDFCTESLSFLSAKWSCPIGETLTVACVRNFVLDGSSFLENCWPCPSNVWCE